MDAWVLNNLNNELLRDAVASERVLACLSCLLTQWLVTTWLLLLLLRAGASYTRADRSV